MTFAVILFIAVIVLLALRVNLVAILLLVCAYIHFVWGDGELVYIIEDMWIAIDKEVFLSIPLFLFVGSIMGRGAIAKRLIDVMQALTAALPGGLAVATILTCAVFAAISGSSSVTLIAVGSIIYPSLVKEGYSKPFSLGAIAAGGTLGVIIPPSIPMILYGIVTETSIVDLFTAGIIPGLLLVLLMSIYTLFVNRKIPSKTFSFQKLLAATKSGIWSLLLPVILLGGIYSGYFSPTEAAAVALGYAILIEMFIHRELSLSDIRVAALETAALVGALFPILAIALSINLVLTTNLVPQNLAIWAGTMITSKVTFLLVINLLLLLVGMVMDMIAAILILAPIILVLGRSYGVDPVHLGIIMTVNLEIGLLTPPVGFNVIVAMMAFREKFSLIVRGVMPFVLVMLVALGLITFIPEISLFLIR